MSNKTKKVITAIIVSIIILAIIIISIYSFKKFKNEFFKLTFFNSLTLIIAVIFSFFITQRNQDNRRFYDSVIKILEDTQLTVTSKLKMESFNAASIESLMQDMRIVRNKIEALKKVKDKLNISDEIKYIEENFNHYKDLIDNHINDYNHLNNSIKDLNNYISLLDSKITETIVKIYTSGV